MVSQSYWRTEARKIIFARDIKLETVLSRRRFRNGSGLSLDISSASRALEDFERSDQGYCGNVAKLLYENITSFLLVGIKFPHATTIWLVSLQQIILRRLREKQ